ncbi:MAG: fatty acid CoA ligase family protein [Thermodesulfobacteriota bacterium]
MNCNIAQALLGVAAHRGGETALIHGRRSWTFSDLAETSARYAQALARQGIGPGSRVMLMVPPGRDFVCLTFALFRLGAPVILIDPGMGFANLRRCIGGVRPEFFIGIPKAQIFRLLSPRPFRTVKKSIWVTPNAWGGGLMALVTSVVPGDAPMFQAAAGDLAAIIFTTGSTGPPKGVQYSHGIFQAQLELIRDYYQIGPGDIDQPAFPLFALFAAALGAKAVIPAMDPARPAQVQPARFIKTIISEQVTYSFGSPAIWNVVSRYCLDNNIRLPVKKILMAGAPVPGELIERVQKIMANGGEIFTPYGATESLPIVSMEGREIVEKTWPETRKGRGTCVGRPLPGITIKIIAPVAGAIAHMDQVQELPAGEIGEIIVSGPVVTRAYDHNDYENSLAKIRDGEVVWHRMGDMGYLDESDSRRLWFCGRKAHRVITENGPMYTICCEAIFNEHPLVSRSALVGVGPSGRQRPVIIVECEPGGRSQSLEAELKALAQGNELTKGISLFLVHTGFPVDIRHNAKIFREKLAVWGAEKLGEDK